MAISDRIEKALEHMQLADYESALLQICPAIDKTAKKKMPKEKVGARFRLFINEYREFIYWGAMGWGIRFIFGPDGNLHLAKVNGTLDKVLYTRARNQLVHDAGLDGTLEISSENGIKIGGDVVGLGGGFIIGLIFAVIGDPVNSTEKCKGNPSWNIGNITFHVNDCWGKYSEIFEKLDQQAKRLISDANQGSV